MVDEYQDTNHTQERMLDLLSNGHNRFMVGDIKQSIYRFRQADPQIFNDKFKAYQEEGAKGRLIPSRKISGVMWKYWTRPMMSFAI